MSSPHVILLLIASLVPNFAFAASPDAMATVMSNIKEVCAQPATAGAHWTTSGVEGDRIDVQVKDAASAGTISFTKEEWSGVQRVLQPDQVRDNDGYRRCVEHLSTLFSAKLPTPVRASSEVDRKIKGFLASNQLAVPGKTYSDQVLASQFNLRPGPDTYLSFPVMSGRFRTLVEEINSPMGRYSRQFLIRDGILAGVMLSHTCNANATVACNDEYGGWTSTIEAITGELAFKDSKLGGGPPGSPFAAKQIAREATVYDDPWRVQITRVDPESVGEGPTHITLIIANNTR